MNNFNRSTVITERRRISFMFCYNGNQIRIKTSTDIWSVPYKAGNRPVSFSGYKCMVRRA